MSFNRRKECWYSTRRIDEIDAKILGDLLKDGRKKLVEIAEEIGVSTNIISKRYKEMKKEGIIVGATAEMNYAHVGYHALAEILLTDGTIDRVRMNEELRKINKEFPGLDKEELITELTAYEIPQKGGFRVFTFMKSLEELETLKVALGKLHFGRLTSYLWTSRIRNIPENLSFGFSKKLKDRVNERQFKRVVSTVKEVDETDRRIIEKLFQNGRMPFSKIAEEIGVTTDTVARRYRKLKRNGTVRTLIQINPSKVGYHCTFDSRIRLKSQRDSVTAMNALSEIPDVFTMVGTTGDYDLHVWALIRDIEHLLKVQKDIVSIPDFGKIDFELTTAWLDMYPGSRHYITTI